VTVLNFTAWQSRATGEALRLAVRLRNEGRLLRGDNLELEDLFKGNIDRFCGSAVRLSAAKQVFDLALDKGCSSRF
jgi:hypothetical protein